MKSIYQMISSNYGIEKASIRRTYQKILKNATITAFIEGLKSHFYRKQGFTALLEALGCYEEICLLTLLALYTQTPNSGYTSTTNTSLP